MLSVGPTGTGKTLTIADKLGTKMPKEYIPEFMVFSAKTSANQTQDLIDGKLDKRLVIAVVISIYGNFTIISPRKIFNVDKVCFIVYLLPSSYNQLI